MATLIYHGTSESRLHEIFKAGGLQPRSRNPHNHSNWEHSIPSRMDAVYFTDVYAPYFAAGTVQAGERWAVLEFAVKDLKDPRFIPDEDFLEQATRGRDGENLAKAGGSMQERTLFYAAQSHLWPEFAEDSLKELGTVAYRGTFPLNTLRRVALFDPKQHPVMAMWFLDPTISLINHRLCIRKYTALTRWLFGDAVDTDNFLNFADQAAINELKRYGKLPEWATHTTEEKLRETMDKLEEILVRGRGVEILEGARLNSLAGKAPVSKTGKASSNLA